MEHLFFYEKQRFNQWWLWLLMTGTAIYITANKYLNRTDLTYSTLTLGAVILLLLIIKLETRITTEGVCVRLFPFNIQYKFYSWNKISRAYVKEYNPLADYGGWGLRYSINNGKALNISGNKGLQLDFIDGSKLLIGTRKDQELADALLRINP